MLVSDDLVTTRSDSKKNMRGAAMKSSSRKEGLEGFEASSQLFPSNYGEDQATSSGMPRSLGANLKCEPFHWPRHEDSAVRFFFCLHVNAICSQ